MATELKFQSKDYDFPKYLWFNYYFVEKSDTGVIPFTLYSTYLNRKMAIETAQLVSKEFSKSKNVSILPNMIITKLRFCELFPLKKEYWKPPEFEIERSNEIETLFRALYKPDLYYFIVTPTCDHDDTKKKTLMRLGLATLKSRIEDIPLWMRNSNMPVVNDAKHAALYELKDLYALDKAQSLTKLSDINDYIDLGFERKND